MNRDTSLSILPALTADLLARNDLQVDNLFNDMWQQLDFNALLNRSGFKKRSGVP